MDLDEIAIRCIPSLERSPGRDLFAEKLSPERLEMSAGYPPRRRIDYLTIRQTGRPLEIQIFGVRKSADTRKALRFFAERRIRTHFVDLIEKPASLGELRRFSQKFGVMALIDKESRRFTDLGLRYAQMSDERWLAKLSEEPLLLRLPLVRNGNQVMIGADETVWRSWVAR